MHRHCKTGVPDWSPSLRGSGLKLEQNAVKMKRHFRLPLYEGVD